MAISQPFSSGGPLPLLDLDLSLRPMLLVSGAAAQLAGGGLASELALTARSRHGEVLIPILCNVDAQAWVPYIEAEAWNEEALARLLGWLALVRTSSFESVKVQVYSREPVPSDILGILENVPMARLQLDLFLHLSPGEFARNGRLLLQFMDRWFNLRLKAQGSSLEELDAFVSRELGDEPPQPVLNTTVHAFGCLTGEIIRRGLGGRWERIQQVGFDSGWCIAFPGMKVNPLGKAEKRFRNGPEDSLFGFYQSIRDGMAR